MTEIGTAERGRCIGVLVVERGRLVDIVTASDLVRSLVFRPARM